MLNKQINSTISIPIILLVIFMFVGIGIVQARTNNNDTVVSLSQLQDNVHSKVVVNATTTPGQLVLVDLSDTTNYKHSRGVGKIEVSQIKITFNADVAATTTIKFGVIASTSASGALADIYWFDEVSFSANNATMYVGRQEKIIDYQPSSIKLGITSAVPNGLITSDISTSTNLFATTTKFTSPVGFRHLGSNPGVGDLVAYMIDVKGTSTTTVQTTYRVTE